MTDLVADAIARFAARFGSEPELVVRSPGRVNLIGDHTDYNDGFVLPMAIDRGTVVAARRRPDAVVAWESAAEGPTRFDTGHLDPAEPVTGWGAYVAGVAWAMDGRIPGSHGIVVSDLPVGAGLSSSASLELAATRVFTAWSDAPWDPTEAAERCRRAENDYVGMPCCIMDQLSVAAGVAGHALLIDCRSLTIEPAPLDDGVSVVILDTGTRRRLVDSAYEERRRACERAAAALGVRALRDATLEDVVGAGLDPVALARARHVVTENARTLAAAASLQAGDFAEVGRLMDESHRSLRDDYEVSSPALEAMVRAARSAPGCFGARMTGAGFGGCAVALVETDALEAFLEATVTAYRGSTGIDAAAYPSVPSAGTRVVTGEA